MVFSFKNQNQEKPLCQRQGLCPLTLTQRKTSKTGTADIFRRFMVSLYVKGKENGHVQAYAPNGAMVLKRWGGLTSKLDGYPVTSEPHLWWQAGPWRKSLSRKIALTRIKFYGRKLQFKAFPTFGQMQGCADFMRLWRNFIPRQFSSWTGFTPL